MNKVNMLILIIISLVVYCCYSDYEFTIYNGNSNQIEINNKKLSEFVCDKVTSQRDTSYYLSLDTGLNKFHIIMNDGTLIDTTIYVGEELYLGVDLEEKTLIGFGE